MPQARDVSLVLPHINDDGSGWFASCARTLHDADVVHDVLVERQILDDGAQHLEHSEAIGTNQALGVRSGREVTIGDHDLIAMTHAT